MAIDPSKERYELSIPIEESDIDVMGHVSNIVYLRWVQAAAIAHWRARATPEQQASIRWVVLRHEIDYKHPAKLGEEILAVTWVGTAKELQFDRHTEILRSPDRKLLARARTVWCPVSAKTGRIMRVDENVRARFSVESIG